MVDFTGCRGLFISFAAAAVVMVALAGPAWADKKEAGRLFAAGQAAVDAGNYLTAIRAFSGSLAAHAHPHTHFALAQAFRGQFMVDRDMAKARRAVDHYRLFSKKSPASPWRPTASAYLLELLAILAKEPPAPATQETKAPPQPTQLMITSRTPGARITIDNAQPAVASPAIRVVKPGDHEVRVSAPGHAPGRRVVRAVKDRLVVIEMDLAQLPGTIRVLSTVTGAKVYVDGKEAGQTPFEKSGYRPGTHAVMVLHRGRELYKEKLKVEPDKTSLVMADLDWTRQRKGSLYVAGASAALGVAGLIVGAMAMREDSAMASLDTKSNPGRSAYDDHLGTRDDLALTSTVLFTVAGTALLTAAGLFWFDNPDPPAGKAPAKAHARSQAGARDPARAGTLRKGVNTAALGFTF